MQAADFIKERVQKNMDTVNAKRHDCDDFGRETAFNIE